MLRTQLKPISYPWLVLGLFILGIALVLLQQVPAPPMHGERLPAQADEHEALLQSFSCSANISEDVANTVVNVPRAEVVGQITEFEKDIEGQSVVNGTLFLQYQVGADFTALGTFTFKAFLVGDEEKTISKLLLINESAENESRIFHGVLDFDAQSASSITVMVKDKLLDFVSNCESQKSLQLVSNATP